MKTYSSNNQLSDVKTIKLFEYQVYNVSDDKPKFLIKKTYDITKSKLKNEVRNQVQLEFSDVMWTIDESSFKFLEDTFTEHGDHYASQDRFRELNEDVIVVQPVKVRYNWDKDDDYKIRQISFDVANDVIDFKNTPELCEYWAQSRTLRNWDGRNLTYAGGKWTVDEKGYPYYDRWSDKHMKLEKSAETGLPRLTLTYGPDGGHNFETIYLKWRLPKGCMVMDTIDRLGGYVFSSTAQNIVVECSNSDVTPILDVNTGHVTARVHKVGDMYLGMEHSTTTRKNGYVLTGLAEAIKNALGGGERNPMLRDFTVTENEIRADAGIEMYKGDNN